MKLDPTLIEAASTFSDMNYLVILIYQMLCERIERKKDYLIVELGVGSGASTVAFLSAIAKKENGAALHSCDIEPCEYAHQRAARIKAPWHFIQQDSLGFAGRFGDNLVDLVLIDTSHEYKQTVAELNTWSAKVAPGGRILLHDTLSRPQGVGAALNWFRLSHNKWPYYNIDVCCGLGVLDKPKE